MKTEKERLIAALNDLLKAHRTITQIWSDETDDTSDGKFNTALCELYPYELSFDELTEKVALWVTSVNTDLSEVE